MKKIPVSTPDIGALEKKYVGEALEEGAISGFFGRFISQFENDFAKYSDCHYGVAVNSGTTALHLALATLRIQEGDEVLVSTLTNMATFFAVLYQGAKAIPIDIETDTLNMDPAKLEERITPRTKAILVVHLFGHPVDMDPVIRIARKHGLFIIEDCAETHGATYKGRKVGSLGTIGCFSFYANKIISTGEGGMLTLNDKDLAERAASLKGLAFGKTNKFMHADIGYNYRMTNIQAAIGCGQLARIEDFISKKRNMSEFYTSQLKDLPSLQLPVEAPYAKSVYWMYHLVLKNSLAGKRRHVMQALQERGIETRESFIPFNMQEIFIEQGLTQFDECPLSNHVAENGFYLPSGTLLCRDDWKYITNQLREVIALLS